MVNQIKPGDTFTRLTVITRAPKDPTKASRSVRWVCRCECGVEKVIESRNLTAGLTRSCGCLQKERAIEVHTTHGGSTKREWGIWSGMKSRCDNPKHRLYKYYGGRGITYDPRWSDFANFFADMGVCEDPEGSIERIDNNKGYCKDNCRWASKEDQQNNTRLTRQLTYNGKTQSLSRWARELDMTPQSLKGRLDRLGWNVEEALSVGNTRTLTLQVIRRKKQTDSDK